MLKMVSKSILIESVGLTKDTLSDVTNENVG